MQLPVALIACPLDCQGRPFGRLRTGPSAGSGQALRQAQDRLAEQAREATEQQRSYTL